MLPGKNLNLLRPLGLYIITEILRCCCVGFVVSRVFATTWLWFLPCFLLGFCVSDFISPVFISQEVEISELLFRIQTYIINVGLTSAVAKFGRLCFWIFEFSFI